jgi:deoxyribonuclease-4
MFGSHLSIAGGLHNALIAARDLSMDCVQVFTKNQRRWTAPPLDREQVDQWFAHRRSTGVDTAVSHSSYLINLASPDRTTRDKSIRLFVDELERCERLEIPYLVAHPGAHKGIGAARGLRRIAGALDRIHKRLPGYRTVTCLEVTAGQGTSLGCAFEHLRRIIDTVAAPRRLAVCLDTAHALAAGYDLTSARGARAVLDELDHVIGLDRVKVVHLNDSKVERGRRVDRHEHIGHGHVALDAFRAICRRFADVPKIMETPKARTDDGREWDQVNLATLRNLVRPRPKRG